MKKSNVISIRLDDEEIETLQLYSSLYNTDKPSSIIKGLLMTNPYFEILKEIIKDLDDKEAKLILLQSEFPKDKEIKKIIDSKIEYLDQIRTDMLRKIDDKLTCIRIAHNLIPKNSIYCDEVDTIQEDTFTFAKVEEEDHNDALDFIDFDEIIESDPDKDLESDALIEKIEEQNRIECKQMKDRARQYLNCL